MPENGGASGEDDSPKDSPPAEEGRAEAFTGQMRDYHQDEGELGAGQSEDQGEAREAECSPRPTPARWRTG
jgi:hypothetical protein